MLDTKDEIIQNIQKAIQLSSSHTNLDSTINKIRSLSEKFLKFSSSAEFQSGSQSFGDNFLESLRRYTYSLSNIFSDNKKLSKYLKVKLKNRVMKIKIIIYYLPLAFSLSQNDFRCLSSDHPRKLAINSITKTTTLDKLAIQKQSDSAMQIIDSFKALLINYIKYEKSTFNFMVAGFNLFYYLYYPKERKMQNRIYEINATLNDLIALWNVANSKLIAKVNSNLLEKILINKAIYLPRTSCHVMESGGFRQISYNEKFYFEDNEGQRTQVILLSAIPILGFCDCSSENIVEVDFVIFDIHGGGHIAQSYKNHEIYTRRWANSLKVPVFAFEYRLAPEHKFPAGLDDVWQTYTWLILNMETSLKIKAKKIILVGDSAGGNLAIGICLKARSCGFRLPDGLFCLYPCVNWDKERVSQGVLQSLNDPILPFKLFYEFDKYYLNSAEEAKHYLVSPIYADKSLLEGLPRTKFLLATRDPLYFDSLEFADRLIDAGVDIEIYEYTDFTHGCLASTNYKIRSVYDITFEDSILLFRKLAS